MAWALKNIFQEFCKSPTELRADVFIDYCCDLVEKPQADDQGQGVNGSSHGQYNILLQTQSLERRVGDQQQQDSALKSKFERV